MQTNAALSGEQRRPPYLNHCAVNTKADSNRKCQALGIRLKCFVMSQLQDFESKLITGLKTQCNAPQTFL
ncbi:hypothetical protein F7Q89_00065 [Vibrio kanaloae]|nr:hypothetical protein F7Q89_00065 [Vibrio kanaloae]